nr:tetratricopeptide repeat protein [uncultured Oscillibacter sp.]
MDGHTTNTRDEDRQVFRQVRSDIQAGELSWAEELLDGVEDRCAEWHFLKGAVCYRKGWLDEARQHYEAAAGLEPGNEEYKRAAERMQEINRYRPKGMPAGTLSALPDLAVCGIICAGGFCSYKCFEYSMLCCCESFTNGCINCNGSCPD